MTLVTTDSDRYQGIHYRLQFKNIIFSDYLMFVLLSLFYNFTRRRWVLFLRWLKTLSSVKDKDTYWLQWQVKKYLIPLNEVTETWNYLCYLSFHNYTYSILLQISLIILLEICSITVSNKNVLLLVDIRPLFIYFFGFLQFSSIWTLTVPNYIILRLYNF